MTKENKEVRPMIRDNGTSATVYIRIPSKIVKELKISKRDWFRVTSKDGKITYTLEK